MAAEGGYKSIVEVLVNAKADITIRDKNGKTPLGIAQEKRHKEIATLLKEKQGASQPPESNVHITGTKKHSSDRCVTPQ